MQNNLDKKYLIFTCDQQLYKVTICIDILFHNPTYLECVEEVCIYGNELYAFNRLKDVLTGEFGSVDKMLSEKNDPQNVQAIRLLIKEVL